MRELDQKREYNQNKDHPANCKEGGYMVVT